MYKEPLDVQSLSARLGQIPFFVPLFFFFSALAPLPGQEEETGEIMFFFPMRGREKERRGWGHERVSKEKQKESQRRSDYCCGERAWLTSLSGWKDKQVINAAGRRPNASRSFAYLLPLVFAELTETVLHNSQVTANTHLSFSTADNEGCAKQRAAVKLRLDFYQWHIELQ